MEDRDARDGVRVLQILSGSFTQYSRYTIYRIVRSLGKCQMIFYFQTKHISDQPYVLELLIHLSLHLNRPNTPPIYYIHTTNEITL